MKKKILYLHVGWSKTGTSAVQSQIQKQRQDFLDKGILYPQSLQWPDHSHHPFALSFKTNNGGPYIADMSISEALNKLDQEMSASSAENVLISSELSPMYFNSLKFTNFAKEKFETVKILFTVRRQSELLISLMNQLVKDPNIRYKGSFFQLGMQNIPQLNFYQRTLEWEKFVGKNNIHCFIYSKSIVRDFLEFFEIPVRNQDETLVINKSVPNRVIPMLQSFPISMSNSEYLEKTSELIKATELESISSEYFEVSIFSVGEQSSFDQYFSMINARLSKEFLSGSMFPTPKKYSQVIGYKNKKPIFWRG